MIQRWSDYEEINENLQKALRILRGNKVSEENKNFLKLREILRNNTGYLGKFTEWLIIQKKSIESLEDLYKKIKEAKVKKSIDDFKTPEEVIDYLIRENSAIAVNQIINSIPSKTRIYLKSSSCDRCYGGGILSCDVCDYGVVDCDCRDTDCEYCHGDGSISCDDCDGGLIECEFCHGDGNIPCVECGGDADKKCKKCKGEGCDECDDGYIECDRCSGIGHSKCEDCDGYGYKKCERCSGMGESKCTKCGDKKCKKCDSKGSYKCKKCDGKGSKKCEECKDGTDEWKSFLDFLNLHADKKDLICDFLSKKGGRYGDVDNFDDDGPLYSLESDIKKLINMPSIESIKKNLKNDKNVRFIYDDDKVLIIASNYEGLQKYGSSYWCITQDRYTFDGYVNESGIKQQWVIFIKGKSPYVDDKSVMGVTIDIVKSEVSAAHWEDDTQADFKFAEKLFNSIDLRNIVKAESIFERSEYLSMFLLPDEHRAEIEDLINEATWSNDKKSIDLESLLGFDEYDLFEGVNKFNTKFFDVVKSILKEKDLKIKFDVFYFDPSIFDFDLKEFTIFNKEWNKKDIDYIVLSKEKEKALDYVGWFVSNGYDIARYLKGRDIPDVLKKLDIENIVINNVSSIDNWSSMIQSLTPRQINNVYKKLLKGDKKQIIINAISKTDPFIKSAIKWIVDEDNLSDYKKDLLDLINYPDRNYQLSKPIIDYILDNIEDDDIETACVYRMLHPKISKKYNFEMKRKPTLENLISWDEF